MTLKSTWVTGETFAATDINAIATAANGSSAAKPQEGAYASLPAPGNLGATYECNDVGLSLYDNGTSWDRYGGPLGSFTAIPGSGWSTVNLGTDTLVTSKDGSLLTMANSGTLQMRMQVRTLTPSSNYTAAFYLEQGITLSATKCGLGIILRNSTSGSLVAWYIGYNPSIGAPVLSAESWASPTTATGSYRTVTVTSTPNWMRIRDDGTSRFFEYSSNGVDWVTFTSSSRTDFIAPDQIGWGGYNQTGQTGFLRLRSLSGIS